MSDDRRADARLADRIRSGDTEALGELYDRHVSMAVATAVRVVGGRDEAEDVVHDAFVAVWRQDRPIRRESWVAARLALGKLRDALAETAAAPLPARERSLSEDVGR